MILTWRKTVFLLFCPVNLILHVLIQKEGEQRESMLQISSSIKRREIPIPVLYDAHQNMSTAMRN